MATIDPSIALGAKPIQIEDPINRFARQQELSVNMMKGQELQRGLAEDEQVRNFLRTADLSKPEVRAELNTKFGKTGMAYGKILQEQEKANLETKELRNKIDKQTLEMTRQRLADLSINPSNENILAHLQDDIIAGRMTQAQAEQKWQRYAGMTLAQRKQEFQQLGMGIKDYETLQETKRGHNLTYAAATQPVFSEAAGGFVTRPDAQGNVKIIPIANPEETKKGKETNIAKANVADITQTMANSYTKLRDMGAMKSVESDAGANLAAGAQSSAVGQFLGGVFGTAEQSERDYVTGQRRLLVQAIAKATGMTASQINSDKELQSMLDAATDTKKGYETNIRTLNDINRRYGTGTPINIALPKDQNAPSAPAAPQDKSPTKANAAKLLPPVNDQGWRLHIDKNGNKAYVGPNGQIQEVK